MLWCHPREKDGTTDSLCSLKGRFGSWLVRMRVSMEDLLQRIWAGLLHTSRARPSGKDGAHARRSHRGVKAPCAKAALIPLSRLYLSIIAFITFLRKLCDQSVQLAYQCARVLNAHYCIRL